MWKLLKNARIFAPESLGQLDMLMVGGLFVAWGKDLMLPDYASGEIVDLKGMLLVPGFIDAHVHLSGGGGERGMPSRTPQVQLSQLTESGVTTVVGCLGFDTVTRSMEDLLAKAVALEDEGISAYIYTGGYQADRTLTGSIRKDVVLIDKVIGAGEIAISDHRSAQPTLAELAHLAAEARIGGMLGGKAGIIHFHLGDERKGLRPLWQLLEETGLPFAQFMPTHINRNPELLDQGMAYLKAGGKIDLTAEGEEPEENLQVPYLLKALESKELLNECVTVTSDGNGSRPRFADGVLVGMEICSTSLLWSDIRKSIVNYGVSMERALKAITTNPAEALMLPRKGRIRLGFDGDCVALDRELNIVHVWAKGKTMVRDSRPVVFGLFEKS